VEREGGERESARVCKRERERGRQGAGERERRRMQLGAADKDRRLSECVCAFVPTTEPEITREETHTYEYARIDTCIHICIHKHR